MARTLKSSIPGVTGPMRSPIPDLTAAERQGGMTATCDKAP
jgi:hypothetical protein